MYQISPTSQLIFRLLNENNSDGRNKLLILFSVLKEAFFECLVIVIGGLGFYFLFNTLENQHIFIIGYSFLFTFIIIATIFYIIKKYTLSIKLYGFSKNFFNKSIDEIANSPNTSISRYMIDYLCIETTLYDAQTVEIKDHDPISYGELKNQVLRVYNKNKSPNIPYSTKEYQNYMHMLQHMLSYPSDQCTFRELYLRSKQ